MIRKREQSDSDPNITANNEQPKLRKSISKSLLDKVGKNDATQLKLAFDSIDRNGDGVLSIQELEEFALQLGCDWDMIIKVFCLL
jgi:Ca2+-binding EF-hand superfamily protein